MIKLKDLLTEQKMAGGRIVIISTDATAAPNANTFSRFQQSHGTIQGDATNPTTKAIRSTGSPFARQFQYVTKTRQENDYLLIGNILINNQRNQIQLTGAQIRQLFGTAEASGNGVYLLSRIINQGKSKLVNSDSVILVMNGRQAGVQTIEFNPSAQDVTRKNAGRILSGYCFVQAGLATPEFLNARDFVITKTIRYNNPVNSAYSFFPSLRDGSLRRNSQMISLGDNLENAVKSFVSKYKGKKMKPSANRRTFYETPWRNDATNDLVAMTKILQDTFKSRHKLFIDLSLQQFGVSPNLGDVLDSKITVTPPPIG